LYFYCLCESYNRFVNENVKTVVLHHLK